MSVLLTSQRNHVFTTIQNRKFSPKDFSFGETATGQIESCHLIHSPTESYFDIDLQRRIAYDLDLRGDNRPPFRVTFSPGNILRSESRECVDWSTVIYSLDYMEEAATRMGRKDWLSLVIGNLMGVAFSLALNGDSTRDLFGFAALVIKRILGTMLYLASPH